MEDLNTKIVEQIKSEFGNLITPEDLKPLIERAISEQFFTPRLSGDSWNKKISPSLFVEEVAKLAKPLLEVEVSKFVASEEYTRAVGKFLEDQQLMLMMVPLLVDRMTGNLGMYVQQIVSQLKS